MRTLFILMGFVCIISSCSAPRFTQNTAHPAPFVELKNGKVMHPEYVEKNTGVINNHIEINGREYKPREVAFYSDGLHTFANIRKNDFAVKVTRGKINVYQSSRTYTSYTGAGYTDHTYRTRATLRFFIQNGADKQLKSLNYKHLRTMIPSGAEGSNYLQHYAKVRNKTGVLAGVGLAIFAGGAAYAAAHWHDNRTPGMIVSGAGLVISLSSFPIKWSHYQELADAVNTYNAQQTATITPPPLPKTP